jgi:hypothetical protein
MTAVTAPPGDTIVSQPQQLKTYAARRAELVLVMKPERNVHGPGGERVDVTPGIRLQFADGVLRVPLTGTVQTQQGREIPAEDVLEFLERHRLYGDRFEGFTEIPQAAPPVSEDEMAQIMYAVAMGDLDRLNGVLDAERSGWNRPEIIKGVQQGLETLQAIAQTFDDDPPPDAKKAK